MPISRQESTQPYAMLDVNLKYFYELDSHQKQGAIPYSWIYNSYHLMSLVNSLLDFEFLNHGTHSTIFNDIVCSDLTSHTCIMLI